jgi:hypothetical protein
MRNFLNNVSYPAFELVLLNYNSKDGLEEWAYENFKDYMAGGVFSYYKTLDPTVFSHSHSKNLAFRLADGDIVCNINADNFIGSGFVQSINDLFQMQENIFLAPDHLANINGGVSGIVCVKKSDFYKVGGFDERMKIYGWEDVDFTNRLQHLGLEKKLISDGSLIGAFSHSEDEKYDKRRLRTEIGSIYANCEDLAASSDVSLIILYEDMTFKSGTIVNNLLRSAEDEEFARAYNAKTFFKFVYELRERYWQTGEWTFENDIIRLSNLSGEHMCIIPGRGSNGDILKKGNEETFIYRINDQRMFDIIAFNMIEYDNRVVMLDNFDQKVVSLNQKSFGRARVFKNFINNEGIMVE